MTTATIILDGTTGKMFTASSSNSSSKYTEPQTGTEISDYTNIQNDDSSYITTSARALGFGRYGKVSHRFEVDLSGYPNKSTIVLRWDGYINNPSNAGSSIAVYENGSWVNKVSLPSSDGEGFEYEGTFDPSALGETIQFGAYGNLIYPGDNVYLYSDYVEVVVNYQGITTVSGTLSFLNNVKNKISQSISLFHQVFGRIKNILGLLYSEAGTIKQLFKSLWSRIILGSIAIEELYASPDFGYEGDLIYLRCRFKDVETNSYTYQVYFYLKNTKTSVEYGPYIATPEEGVDDYFAEYPLTATIPPGIYSLRVEVKKR